MKKNKILGLALCAAITVGSSAVFAAEKVPVAVSGETTQSETIVGVPQITVNGASVDLSNSGLSQYIFEENGNVMVPFRAVAEKMGYEVSWDGEKNAFSAETDEWRVTAYIDQDLYFGVTKIEGAVGMTAPQSYGTAPMLVEDRTFVPAKMFELMGFTYNSTGQFVNFSDRNTIVDKDGREYSNNTLIISVSEDTSKSDIMDLFEKNGLEVIDELDNIF